MRWVVVIAIVAGCGRFHFDEINRNDGDGRGDDGAGGDGVNMIGTTNVMFVTSTTAVPELTGIAGADAMCADRATSVGLAGTFVAWISSSTSFAKDRLGSARGWIRVDGRPFADTIADLTSGHVLGAPVLDETGTPVAANTYIFTGTSDNGTALATCNDYVPGSPYGTHGLAHSGLLFWTNFYSFGCSSPDHFYCFQTDHARPISLPTPQRHAFVSTAYWLPSSGIAAADTRCNSDATAAGLTGSYRALLATTTTTAASRFTIGAPWSRMDGVVVLEDFSKLLAPILTAADGSIVTGGGWNVWAGAVTPTTLGTTASTCGNWTQLGGSFTGAYADMSMTDSWPWTNPSANCTASIGGLICLEQ